MMTPLFAATGLGTVGLMAVVWLFSVAKRDVSIVDVFWGLGFVLIATISSLMISSATSRAVLLYMLTALWGVRLAIYLFWRNWGLAEDYRYQAMRRRWGERFVW